MNAIQQSEEAKETEESNLPENPNALLNAPTTSDDDTINDRDEEDSDMIAKAQPPTLVQQDNESDLLAWSLIARLLSRVQNLNYRIAHPELEPEPSFENIRTNGNKGRRIDLILEASPLTRLNLARDQLVMILFDTVRVVGLNGLEGVLNVLECLLFHGYVPSWALSDIISDDTAATKTSSNQITAGNGIETMRTLTEEQTEGHSEASRQTMYVGLGIQTNPDTSPLWQSLINTIGHARGFDYARKTKCVGWYMNTLNSCRSAWKEHSREKNEGEGERKKKAVSKPLPPGHPLRARL